MKKTGTFLSPFLTVAALSIILLVGCGDDNGINGGDEDITIDGSAVYNGDLFVAGSTMDPESYFVKRLSGSSWQTIGTGIDNWCSLLCAGDSGLYIAGDFTTVGGISANHIARWDGTTWAALGTGIGGDKVWSIIATDGNLYAGGDFPSAGGVMANYIAKWDESTSEWSAMMSAPAFGIYRLAVSENLYAAGNVVATGNWQGRVVRYDGPTWTQTGAMNGPIEKMIGWAGGLTAAGYFDSVGNVAATGIATLIGSQWSPLGTGLADGMDNLGISAMAEYNSQLIVAGHFDTAGGVAVTNIARWDGANWYAMGSGLEGNINTLAVYNGVLVAGGSFDNSNGHFIGNLARWNGTAWTYE